MTTDRPATIVRLSQPIMDGPREVSEIYLAGKPGLTLPLEMRGEEAEIDALTVERMIADRCGLSVAAVRRLAPLDLFTVFGALFMPHQSADIVSLNDKRKAKK